MYRDTRRMATAESKPLYHLVQESLWQEAVAKDETYYPPTYQQVSTCMCLIGCGGTLVKHA